MINIKIKITGLVFDAARLASNITGGKTKWIEKKSLKGIDWMYRYFHVNDLMKHMYNMFLVNLKRIVPVIWYLSNCILGLSHGQYLIYKVCPILTWSKMVASLNMNIKSAVVAMPSKVLYNNVSWVPALNPFRDI